MRKDIFTGVSLVALSAGMAQAGGFELQTLDTSMMYADGNTGSISIADINASVSGTRNGVTVDTVKDQRVTNIGFKMDAGVVDLGLYTCRSGAIQLSGGNDMTDNYAPTGDIDINSTTLMASYDLNENISFLGGITQNSLTSGNVTTIKGGYDVKGASSTGYVLGAAYSIPDIAFRAEVLYQPASKIKTKTRYDGSAQTAFSAGVYAQTLAGGGTQAQALTASQNAAAGANLLTGDYDTELSRPESLTINVQSGIAADTLLFASYHRAKWSGAPVLVDVASAAGGAIDPKIDETFDDSEKFSIGVGRKFSERLSGSLSYSKEEGSGADATSLFTFSNGTETISAGLRYTIDNMDISVGVSRSTLGDVTVDGGAGPIAYKGNSVTAMGVKVAFAF
jgi:long-subunit fatty acid transport protein